MVAGLVNEETRAKWEQEMTDCAWMSVAAVNPELMFAISTEAVQDGPPEAKAVMLDAIRKNQIGVPIPDGVLPPTFFAWRGPLDDSKPLTTKLPHLSSCGGFRVISAEAADVLRQFDLGGCKLHPVKVLMEDRKTPLPGSYFVLDCDSWKDAFLPEQSPQFMLMDGSRTRRRPTFSSPDDIAALSRDALLGPDIWWNPDILAAFFLSDRLARALRAAGVDKPFSLRRCRIV